jgi:hypothetical protein
MVAQLERMKRLLSTYSNLPSGLTTKLMLFMEPFATMATLRGRLKTAADAAPKASAPLEQRTPTALPAAAAPSAPASTPASAAARPASAQAPSVAEIERGKEALRTCVQARCAALRAAASTGSEPHSSGDDFAPSAFKWDRPCEDALYGVVVTSQRQGAGAHKNVYKELVARGMWPADVDASALKLAYNRARGRRKTQQAKAVPSVAAAAPPRGK